MLQAHRLLVRCILIHLGIIPLYLIGISFYCPDLWWLSFIYPCLGCITVWCINASNSRHRIIAYGVLSLFLFLMLTFLLTRLNYPLLYTMSIITVILSLHVFRKEYLKNYQHDALLRSIIIASFLGYTAIQILHTRADSLTLFQPFTQVIWPARFAFLIYMFILLLWQNQDSLTDAGHGRRMIPSFVRKKNILLSSIFSLFIVTVSLIHEITAFFNYLWNQLMQFVHSIVQFLLALLHTENESGGSVPPIANYPSFGAADEYTPGWLAILIERLVEGLAIILSISLLILAVRFLCRKMVKLFHRLQQYFSRVYQSLSDDYTDEIISIQKEADPPRLIKQMQRNRRRFLKVDASDPTMLVRQRYRKYQLKHPEWDIGSTPRMHLGSHMADIYEKARYSQISVSSDEADAFRP